jgi:hypothetical protein
MSTPHDLDDGWAELARELGLENDRPFPAPPPDHPPADLHPPEDPAQSVDDEEFVEEPGEAPTDADVYADAAGFADIEGDADTDEAEPGDDGEEGDDADGEGEAGGTGEPGEPKKKRRRRRRRKKKPADGTPAGETHEGGGAEEPDPSVEPDESDELPLPADGLVEEEGASPAATRELIANWDVPSWETIVNTMLYRPQGR